MVEKMMNNSSSSSSSSSSSWKKSCNVRIIREYGVLILALGVAFLVLYCASYHNFSFSSFKVSYSPVEPVQDEYYELKRVLKAASTKDKTVIVTYLNKAWAAPNSIFETFLDSFILGNNTASLLHHLMVVALDEDAFLRCKSLVSHCYLLKSNESSSSKMSHQAMFMSPVYLDMMWSRLSFLHTILTLGYNFLITDTDVIWLRDPFLHFDKNSDFQPSCDRFNSRQFDLNNNPNMGFHFARSNVRTIKFYEYWVSSRHRYPNLHDQDAFNKIKHEPSFKQIGLKVRFLATDYFGGFCSVSRDFNKVCTMHANCCVGLDRKIADLNTALEDWKSYISSNHTSSQPSKWHVPKKCHM